jgi:hypothetical protein
MIKELICHTVYKNNALMPSGTGLVLAHLPKKCEYAIWQGNKEMTNCEKGMYFSYHQYNKSHVYAEVLSKYNELVKIYC